MNETVIKISRSKYIETNRSIAVIRLNDEFYHQVGQPVMLRYYDGIDQSKVNAIMAIGIKDGVGPDCYRIVSYGEIKYLRGVGPVIPDVSALTHREVYAWLDEDGGNIWNYVFLDSGEERCIEPITGGPHTFVNLEDNSEWYFYDGVLRREGDYYTRAEVDAMIFGINETIRELDERFGAAISDLNIKYEDLKDKVIDIDALVKEHDTKILDLERRVAKNEGDLVFHDERLTALETDMTLVKDEQEVQNEKLSDLNDRVQDIEELELVHYDEIDGRINRLEDEVFPLTLHLSTISDSMYLQGSPNKTVVFRVKVMQGDTDLTEACDYTANGSLITPNVNNEFSLVLSTTKEIIVEATLRDRPSTVAEARTTITFGYNFYYGPVPTDWEINAENVLALEEVELQDKREITYISNLTTDITLVYACPKIYGSINRILDVHELDYINSYKRTELNLNGIAYYIYVKEDAVSINNFKQTYSY